jgi:hypothetical protein
MAPPHPVTGRAEAWIDEQRVVHWRPHRGLPSAQPARVDSLLGVGVPRQRELPLARKGARHSESKSFQRFELDWG